MKTGFSLCRGICTLLALMLLAHSAAVQAAPPRSEAPPARPLYSPTTPPINSGAAASGRGLVNQPQALNSFDRLVFQSYRDGNWEIYSNTGQLNSLTRLTNLPANDIEPRYDLLATRIAFASNRTGHYQIYTMQADGTGQSQLTTDQADNLQPSWSHDGTHLVFQSYRDGQSEIYVMNANGSGQTRLTFSADFDGQPAWSPDGQRIAFISRRTGGYRVWIMNANGSGQTQLSSQPYSANPAWSPDGSQIAYDADADGNGWQDIWLMNSDGSNQRLGLMTAGSQTDSLVRSWTRDGKAVAFTEVHYIFSNGQWYWTSASLADWDITVPNAAGITYLSAALDWLPDWQSVDPWPPNSRVEALPTYSRSPVIITWSGSDVGPAGINHYEVQYRQGAGGTWTDLNVAGNPTTYSFTGSAGATYFFRSRAFDNADNMEPWPPGDGNTHTTFFDWALTGSARDNAGTALAGVSPLLAPAVLTTSASDGAGNFVALGAMAGLPATANWSKSGYGALPPTNLDTGRDTHIGVVLPPADNLIQNWDFESGSLGPQWLALGAPLPVVTQTTRHTGQSAAVLGQDQLFAPMQVVTTTAFDAALLQSAMDASGAIHAAWVQSTNGIRQLYYARRDSGGAWSNAAAISHNSNGDVRTFSLVVEGGGVVHVLWQEMTGVFYTRRAVDGTWSSPINIFPTQGGQWTYALHSAAAADGTLHVLWTNNDTDFYHNLFYARRSSNGAWDAVQNLTRYVMAHCPSYGSCVAQAEQLTVDANGNAHALWSTASSTTNYFNYARRDANGVWRDGFTFPIGVGNSPRLAVADSGVVYVLWSASDGSIDSLHYRWRAPNGTWSDPSLIAGAQTDDPASVETLLDGAGRLHVVWDSGQYQQLSTFYTQCSQAVCAPVDELSNAANRGGSPAIAVDSAGTIHVVWSGTAFTGNGLMHTWRSAASGWAEPRHITSLSPSYYGPAQQLLLDAQQGLHVLWLGQVSYPGNSLLYLAPALDAQTGTSAISQAVHIPASMTTAMLSFLYRLGGASASDRLDVEISNGLTTSVPISRVVDSSDWSHAWVDVAPWAGQTVTVTLRLYEGAGTLATWAELDEVTLGAGHTDVWVKVSGSRAGLPGQTAAYQITYGNTGGVAAQNAVVTCTLPSQLQFVSASPSPAGSAPLTWPVGSLDTGSGPFTIWVTATIGTNATFFTTLNPTASIASLTPELELENNTAQGSTYVGAYLFLPLIQR